MLETLSDTCISMICVTSKCKCTLMNQRIISSKNGAKVMQYQVWEGAGSSISEAVGSRSEYPAVELSVSSHKDDPRDRKSGNWSLEPGSWNLGGAKMASGVPDTIHAPHDRQFNRQITIGLSSAGETVLQSLLACFWCHFGPHWHPHGSLLMAFGRLWHHFCPKWLLVWFPCGTVFVPSGALLVSLAPLSGTSWWQATAKATKNVDM